MRQVSAGDRGSAGIPASSCCLPILPFLMAAGFAGSSEFLSAARICRSDGPALLERRQGDREWNGDYLLWRHYGRDLFRGRVGSAAGVDSATTARTPPGGMSLKTVVIRWTRRTIKWRIRGSYQAVFPKFQPQLEFAMDRSGATPIYRGASSRPATVWDRFRLPNIRAPFTSSRAISEVAARRMSGFKKVSASWENITSTMGPTMSTLRGSCHVSPIRRNAVSG